MRLIILGLVCILTVTLFSCNSIFENNSFASDEPEEIVSHFECKELGNGKYHPYWMQAINEDTEFKDWSKTSKGLLGQNAMKSLEECERALEVANHKAGVICSRTGLDGWKPTLYTGTRPGRVDFGYLGGSSIMKFESCLLSTQNSSSKGVCFWGGSDWYVSALERESTVGGPFGSIEKCVEYTKNGVH
jgi:hypothetical protein